MLGRIAALAVLMAAAGCAGLQSAGRTAQRADAPAPAASQPAPPPAQAALPPSQPSAAPAAPTPLVTTPPGQAAPAPSAAAPAAPTPSPAREARADGDDTIVVPGQRDIQVRPPDGDPRSIAERMEDVRAWDQCVMQVQSAFESDPMRPQLESPEEYCSRSLGMANRTAVPLSRRTP